MATLTVRPSSQILTAGGTIGGALTVSGLLNISTTAGITASTTQTQGQGALTSNVNNISVCANANDTVTLPAASAGLIVEIFNNGAQTLQVFPASGDNIDGAGVNTAVTMTEGSNHIFTAHDTTNWNRSTASL